MNNFYNTEMANSFEADRSTNYRNTLTTYQETQLDNEATEQVHLINPVLRVEASSLTPDIFFEKYQKPGIPVIITGLLQNEPDWNLDYLCQQLGKHEFVFRNYGRSKSATKSSPTGVGSGVAVQTMRFNEYAKLLRNRQAREQDIYLGKCSLKRTSLAHTPRLNKVGDKLGLTQPATDLYMYMGAAGHSSGLHYDSMDGTLMQLHGVKKLVLFPPQQTKNLYPLPIYLHLRHGLKLRSWFSQVDIQHPNLSAFPQFRTALQHQQQAIVNPGEIFYIPAGWWHEVMTLGDEMVCSVSRFWRVYPVSRALFSQSRWRAVLGFLLAMPHTASSFLGALFSNNRRQKIRQIWHRV